MENEHATTKKKEEKNESTKIQITWKITIATCTIINTTSITTKQLSECITNHLTNGTCAHYTDQIKFKIQILSGVGIKFITLVLFHFHMGSKMNNCITSCKSDC